MTADLKLVSARLAAQYLIEHATIAFYLAVDWPDEAKRRRDLIDVEFLRMAALLGYDLVKREGGE